MAGIRAVLETPEHLFFFCPITSILLAQLAQWAPVKLLNIDMSAFNVLIWHQSTSRQLESIQNSLLIWFKYFIFSCKKSCTRPIFSELIYFILKQAKEMDQALSKAKKESYYSIFSHPDDYILLETGLVKIFWRNNPEET